MERGSGGITILWIRISSGGMVKLEGSAGAGAGAVPGSPAGVGVGAVYTVLLCLVSSRASSIYSSI